MSIIAMITTQVWFPFQYFIFRSLFSFHSFFFRFILFWMKKERFERRKRIKCWPSKNSNPFRVEYEIWSFRERKKEREKNEEKGREKIKEEKERREKEDFIKYIQQNAISEHSLLQYCLIHDFWLHNFSSFRPILA